MKSKERVRLPPYVTYATWQRLLEALRHHLPGRVDRSYLRDLGFSESSILTIKTALSFLGLVDDQHEPTERLRKLALADQESYKVLLSEMIKDAYEPVVGGVNLETATLGLLKERFTKYGADNNVGSKCLSFFLAMAKDAGISLSPYLLNRSRIGATQKASRTPAISPARRRRPSASRNISAKYDNGPAITPLAAKLPNFDPEWPKEVRDEWFEHLQTLQTILAVIQKLPSFNAEWPTDVQTKWFECMREFMTISSAEPRKNRY